MRERRKDIKVKTERMKHKRTQPLQKRKEKTKEKEKLISLGAKKIFIGHRISQSKFLQFVGLFNLRRNSGLLKKLKLTDISVVICSKWKVDTKNKRLYIPWDFSEKEIVTYLSKMQRMKQQKQKRI